MDQSNEYTSLFDDSYFYHLETGLQSLSVKVLSKCKEDGPDLFGSILALLDVSGQEQTPDLELQRRLQNVYVPIGHQIGTRLPNDLPLAIQTLKKYFEMSKPNQANSKVRVQGLNNLILFDLQLSQKEDARNAFIELRTLVNNKDKEAMSNPSSYKVLATFNYQDGNYQEALDDFNMFIKMRKISRNSKDPNHRGIIKLIATCEQKASAVKPAH